MRPVVAISGGTEERLQYIIVPERRKIGGYTVGLKGGCSGGARSPGQAWAGEQARGQVQTIKLTGWVQQGGRASAPAVQEESRSSLSLFGARGGARFSGSFRPVAHLAGRVVGERRCLWVAAWVGSLGDMPRGARLQGWDLQPGIVTRSGRLSRQG